ncbi:MAG: hypothetical protein NC299_05860 [Lachnospiraceae bacterium]|nr:hypothetical protein [Ruminococcus sp.]MCM1274877.1 hypothetical protein [Lachnospiraceae bacterium]
MQKKNKRICPCCGKRLELVPPSRELYPSTTGFSTNGVVYYFAPAKRFFRVTSHPSAAPQGGQNNGWHFEGRLSPNLVQFDRRYPGWHIVPVNYAEKRIKRDGLFLFSNELVLCCKHCSQRLTLNVNPVNRFEFVFLLWLIAALAALCVSVFISGNADLFLQWLWGTFIASLVILSANVIVCGVSLITVKCRESNFVPTDERGNLVCPPTDIRLSAALRSPYLREGNVLSARLDGGEIHMYLIHKRDGYEFSICCGDGERAEIKRLLSERSELELAFEGKRVGTAAITEVIYDDKL